MKPKLLLLHGAIGTKHQFKNLIPLLENKFHVVAIDFDGHGENQADHPFSIEFFTENALKAVSEYRLEETIIFGYSMGGYVALNLARQYPEKVKKVITLATKFNWTQEIAEREIRMLNPDKIQEKVPHFAEMLAKIHSKNDWKTVLHKTAELMIGLGKGNGLNLDDLKQIKVPVLVNIGEEDKLVSIEESKTAALALPNGSLNILPGVPHPIEKVDPAILADLITNYLI